MSKNNLGRIDLINVTLSYFSTLKEKTNQKQQQSENQLKFSNLQNVVDEKRLDVCCKLII